MTARPTVLIPVRSIAGAKNRLGRSLDDEGRRRLTLAMLADMVAAALPVASVRVLSGDRELLDHAAGFGAEPMLEAPSGGDTGEAQPPSGAHGDATIARGGLNRAVHDAAKRLAAAGVEQLLAIPGDVPLIHAEEIAGLFAAGKAGHVVLVPSASHTGTNGLLLCPPTLIAPQFEGASLAAHRLACATARVSCTVVALAGFALDVDTIEDLETLARHESDRRSVGVARALLEARGGEAGVPQAAAAQRS